MNEFWMLSNAFSMAIDTIIWFFLFRWLYGGLHSLHVFFFFLILQFHILFSWHWVWGRKGVMKPKALQTLHTGALAHCLHASALSLSILLWPYLCFSLCLFKLCFTQCRPVLLEQTLLLDTCESSGFLLKSSFPELAMEIGATCYIALFSPGFALLTVWCCSGVSFIIGQSIW